MWYLSTKGYVVILRNKKTVIGMCLQIEHSSYDKGGRSNIIEGDSEEEKQKGEEIKGGNNQDWKEGINGKVFGWVWRERRRGRNVIRKMIINRAINGRIRKGIRGIRGQMCKEEES